MCTYQSDYRLLFYTMKISLCNRKAYFTLYSCSSWINMHINIIHQETIISHFRIHSSRSHYTEWWLLKRTNNKVLVASDLEIQVGECPSSSVVFCTLFVDIWAVHNFVVDPSISCHNFRSFHAIYSQFRAVGITPNSIRLFLIMSCYLHGSFEYWILCPPPSCWFLLVLQASWHSIVHSTLLADKEERSVAIPRT